MGRRARAAIATVMFVPAAAGTSATPEPALGAPVIAAAGDIACRPGLAPTRTTCRQALTARLLVGRPRLKAVLALGDEQYPSGSLRDFRRSYGRTWGRVLRKTRPVPGNHEYGTRGAGGYFRYFGARARPRGRAGTPTGSGAGA